MCNLVISVVLTPPHLPHHRLCEVLRFRFITLITTSFVRTSQILFVDNEQSKPSLRHTHRDRELHTIRLMEIRRVRTVLLHGMHTIESISNLSYHVVIISILMSFFPTANRTRKEHQFRFIDKALRNVRLGRRHIIQLKVVKKYGLYNHTSQNQTNTKLGQHHLTCWLTAKFETNKWRHLLSL